MAETEEVRTEREYRERKAAGLCVGCGGNDGVEIYRSSPHCAVCREGHREIDERIEHSLTQIRAAKPEAAGGAPWSAPPSERPATRTWNEILDEQEQRSAEKPPPEPAEVERLPWEQPARREPVDEDALRRIVREELAEVPASVVMALEGHADDEGLGRLLAEEGRIE